MGLSVQRDNIDQVRSMISVKQKQQAIIDQRRGSAADILPTPSDPPPRTSSRRSPNQPSSSRRPPQQRAPSPPPAPQQQQQQAQPHSLPPPPISFARRRAALMGAKKKPADIVISPREAHSKDQFQPSIQSAPPSQNSFRFQMAIPRLPNIIGSSDNVRRTATNVPPTPTRLSMQAQQSLVQNRSPPAPSVPISSSLVPPTPTSLHRPGYQGDKAAFLAPFDLFYDALNDSKQLKTWLAEQLQKSSSLIQSLTRQQDRINDTVESLVEKRLSGIRSEMTALRRRVGELEEALNRSPTTVPAQNKVHQNGLGTVAPEAYTFPAVSSQEPPSRLRPDRPELTRRLSSPRQHPSENGNGRGSPASFDAQTRMSMSATRHEPLPPPPPSASSSRSAMQSPPQVYRDREPAPPKHASHQRPPTPPSRHSTASGPPSLSRQNSGVPLVVVSAERDRREDREREYADRERDRDRDGRRDTVMSPPEDDR
ncbi:hypothetical protein CPB84DRAFT_1766406 [Gymnopilus junonius]|uniref:Uncharacterized protein n=1 Tax=Gymnopilus junonius TaxID=109634 RepID=A0A9P5NTT4_GYMJU|nr:hypothetical protein CPB84DRAFT_1766406 [Gymnopilus junonius]